MTNHNSEAGGEIAPDLNLPVRRIPTNSANAGCALAGTGCPSSAFGIESPGTGAP